MSVPFGISAFAAGELSPAVWGNVALPKFAIGAATLRNFMVDFRGGALSRAGFLYVATSPQTFGIPPRLVRFQFSNTQGIVLEFGELYLRFIVNGAYVLVPATGLPYQIATPYGSPHLRYLKFAQSADVMNITCVVPSAANFVGSISGTVLTVTKMNSGTVWVGGILQGAGIAANMTIISAGTGTGGVGTYNVNISTAIASETINEAIEYPPYTLSRLAAASWTLVATNFSSAVPAPVIGAISATVQPNPGLSPPTLPCAYAYCVTAVDPSTGQESVASGIANITNSVDIAATAGSIIIDWSPVSLPSGFQPFYNIYKAPPSYDTAGSSTVANPVPAGAFFGLVGTSYGTQFVDTNITPDLTQVPPLHLNPFAPGKILAVGATGSSSDFTGEPAFAITTSTGTDAVVTGALQWSPSAATASVPAAIVLTGGQDYASTDTIASSGGGGSTQPTLTMKLGPLVGTYPSTCGYYQQRLGYGGSLNNPDTLWFSQPGQYTNFDARVPPIASDAITATPWAQQVNGIQWMLQMPNALVAFTGNGTWAIAGTGSFLSNPQPITPTGTQATPQAAVGTNATVPPIPINYDIIYLTAKGYSVRDLVYQPYFSLYYPRDISILSTHLLEGHSIVEWAWAEEPHKVLWAVRDDGVLLSLTYLQEQDVYGWARHDSQGLFCSVCTITEQPFSGFITEAASQDALYAVVQRHLGGNWVYTIERMDDRLWYSIEDSVCVDCAFQSAPTAPVGQLSISPPSAGVVTMQAYNCAPFSAGSVGSTIRGARGIFKITGYTSPTVVTGSVILPGVGASGAPYGANPATPFFIDAGSWTISPNVTSVTMADPVTGGVPLAGLQVIGVADGVPVGPLTVGSGGLVLLPFPASYITLGLPFTAQLQSLYANPPGPVTVQGRRKNISDCVVRVATSGFGAFYGSGAQTIMGGSNQPDGSTQSPMQIAPAWSNLVPVVPGPEAKPPASYTTAGGATCQPFYSGDMKSWLQGTWRKPGQLAIQVTGVPLNVTALVLDINPGDLPEAGVQEDKQQPPGARGSRGPGLHMLS